MVVVLIGAMPAAASTLEDQLRQQNQGKVYLLRHFYRGTKLHFAADGSLVGNNPEGPWTIGRVEVKKLSLDSDRLLLEGPRVGTYFDSSPVPRLMPLKENVHLEVDLPSGAATVDSINAVLEKVFIINSAGLAQSVPPYWCAFFKVYPNFPQLVPSNTQPVSGCGIGSPHVNSPVQKSKKDTADTTGLPTPADGVFKVGSGVSAPKIISVPDPDYEPLAKEARFQGTSVLWLVVDRKGMPQNIQVVRALGMGLDERAVQAVSRWRFKPSMKDGQPVPVQINVEVNFRLY